MKFRFGAIVPLLLYMLGCISCTAGSSPVQVRGIFNSSLSLSIYKQAIHRLNKSETDVGYHLTPDRGLYEWINVVKMLRQSVSQKHAMKAVLLTDFELFQNEILKETVAETGGNQSNRSVKVENSLSGNHQASLHLHVAEEMLQFLDIFNLPLKRVSVIVDDTEIGKRTLTHLMQKAPAYDVLILSYKILSDSIEQSEFLWTMNYGINMFLVDCNGKDALQVFRIAKTIGAAGLSTDIKWILSKRTMDSLLLQCSIPAGTYYGIAPHEPIVNASYIFDMIARFGKQEAVPEMPAVSLKESTKYRLWANEDAQAGKSWVPIQKQQAISHLGLVHAKNPFLPRVKVAVSVTAPWLMVANFNPRFERYFPCGIGGRMGMRATGGINETVCFYGYAIDILKAVEEKLHFVGEVQISSDGKYGTYQADTGKADTGTANGIVGDLFDGKAELGIDLIEDKTRNKAVDFTTPYAITSIAIAYLQQTQYKEGGIFGPFSPELWLGIIGVIALLVVTVWFWERYSPYGQHQINKRTLENSKAFGLDDSANYVMGTFFTGEIIDQKPKTFGSHIAIIVISFVSILVISAYSANLITFLVVMDEEPLVSQLLDPKLVDDSSKLLVGIHSSTVISGYLQSHNDPRVRKMFRKRVRGFGNFDGAVTALRNKEVDLIIYDYFSLSYTQFMDRDCSIKVLQLKKIELGIGLSFNKASTWKRRFNLAVIDMVNSGEADAISKRWFSKQICKLTNKFHSLDITRMSSLFVWVSIGSLACIIIFLTPFAFKCCRDKCKRCPQ